MKEYSADASLLTKYATGAIVSCSLFISSCSDSDLPALQRDAIATAQERLLAAEQANQGVTETPAEETPVEVPAAPAPVETEAPEIGEALPSVPAQLNTIDLDGFQLVFNENFDSGEIDASKWNTALPWGPDITVNNEEQYYIDTQNDPEFAFSPFRIDVDLSLIHI